MALLPILRYPDPRLHTVAQSVQEFGPRLQSLVADMIETMYTAKGIGLAATQVDVHERVVVLDVSEQHDCPQVLINPRLVWVSEECVVGEEGCLSVPGEYDKVSRHAAVHIDVQDTAGAWRRIEAEGLLAVCIQHEMDHLAGKVFVEYLSPLKRSRIRSRLRKAEREA
ncbi:peptide deformylase [Candidatus Symbiobacter mobilis]|uniref:Peptide deformylase n=1 Tax=Candidatus Symbiobacter mobilis CR TaxID=946483 RepID=U5N990_9BURK|nr:peptide deformylase [Candidatus Symbiobacter mobilis]AGX87860.1 N-formylmethionyl-tRNA deformylase-like protein [Candidatus Symbiobacter mobilis CR]